MLAVAESPMFLPQVIPGVAIAFCSYELMKKLLKVRVNVTNR